MGRMNATPLIAIALLACCGCHGSKNYTTTAKPGRVLSAARIAGEARGYQVGRYDAEEGVANFVMYGDTAAGPRSIETVDIKVSPAPIGSDVSMNVRTGVVGQTPESVADDMWSRMNRYMK